MYICICVCVFIYTYMYIQVYTNMYIHTKNHRYIYSFTYTYIYIRIHINIKKYIYIHVNTYPTSVNVCSYLFIYINKYQKMHVCSYEYLYIFIYMFVYIYMHMYKYIFKHTHICVCTYICTDIYIHIYIHIYMYFFLICKLSRLVGTAALTLATVYTTACRERVRGAKRTWWAREQSSATEGCLAVAYKMLMSPRYTQGTKREKGGGGCMQYAVCAVYTACIEVASRCVSYAPSHSCFAHHRVHMRLSLVTGHLRQHTRNLMLHL
jgi:hypothetical protein